MIPWPVVIARYDALWRELRAISRATTSTPTVLGLATIKASYDRLYRGYPSHLLHDSATITATPDAAVLAST